MRAELPVISFICFILVLLPLPWHWRARNVATLTMIVSLALTNLFRGVSSIVWAGSVVVHSEVWCDIVAKWLVGAQVSIPAASFCIAKHLESVASVRSTHTTRDDKRRRTIFELIVCVGLPCLVMALHYIVQGHRFDILEDFGCQPTTYFSWPALIIVYMPPIFLSLLTLGYASVGFYWFLQRRAQFAEHLQSHNSGLTTGRYFRLMAFSVSVVLFYISLGGYVITITIQDTPLRVWDTWENVHSNWYRVAQFPRALYPNFYWSRLLMTWYIIPAGSVLFFIFFGFGQEARVEYGKMILWFRTKVLRQTIRPSNESVLPTFSVPYRNESTGRVERVVKLEDDIDMMSIDEKWDTRQDDADVDADKHSLAPSASSSQTQPITSPPPAATQEAAGKPSQPRDSRPISIQLPSYSNDPASHTN